MTIFHLFELAGPLLAMALGAITGDRWFGWPGAIIGGVLGGYLGLVLGRLPFAISSQLVLRAIKRTDTAALRARLEKEYYLAHIIIAELVVRGEPIESFGDYVDGLLNSESADQRSIGENLLKFWPEAGPRKI